MGLTYLENQFNCEDVMRVTDCKETLNDCKSSCVEAVEILNQLLLHEKIESNLLVLDKDCIDIKEYLVDAINPYHRQVIVL